MFKQDLTNHCVLHAINNAFGTIMIPHETMDYAHEFNDETKWDYRQQRAFNEEVAKALLSRLGYKVVPVTRLNSKGRFLIYGNVIPGLRHCMAYRNGLLFDSLQDGPIELTRKNTLTKFLSNISFFQIVPGSDDTIIIPGKDSYPPVDVDTQWMADDAKMLQKVRLRRLTQFNRYMDAMK